MPSDWLNQWEAEREFCEADRKRIRDSEYWDCSTPVKIGGVWSDCGHCDACYWREVREKLDARRSVTTLSVQEEE